MAIKKQDLQEAYDKPISQSFIIEDYAEDFIIYAIGILVTSGIVNAILVAFLRVYGILFGILLQVLVLYFIVNKLFETVDKLVVNRMNRRERELLESIEEKE